MKPFALLLIFAAFFQTQVQAGFTPPIEYKNLKKAYKGQDLKLIAGNYSLYTPERNKKLIGVEELKLNSPTSNFEGSFFKMHEFKVALSEPISKEFIKWADKVQPGSLVFQPVEKGDKTTYNIIGYSKSTMRFLPEMEMFPEFEGFEDQFVDFSVKKNVKAWENRNLVSGGMWFPREELKKGKSPLKLNLHYATFNNNESGALYVETITLKKAIDADIINWMWIFGMGDPVFAKIKGTKKWELVGYGRTNFLFKESMR